MLKAAALYLVLIVSLLIAMLSVSLLTVAFYYRLAQQHKTRLDRLHNNLQAATAILLSVDQQVTDSIQHIDLFDTQQDSIILQQEHWGVYTLNNVVAFEQKDTLKRAFLSALSYTDSSAIYMADEDRPLLISGHTKITGNGQLPKSGLQQAYVDGKAYTGKKLLYGKTSHSNADLLPLDEKWLAQMSSYFSITTAQQFNVKDSLVNSFFNPVKVLKMPSGQLDLAGIKLQGKVVLLSDTILNIHSDLQLDNLLIYAPAIVIQSGFKGSCQLFARDSIIIGQGCKFLYPSFAGLFKKAEDHTQPKLLLGEDSRFCGILLSQEKKRSDLQTLISLGKGSLVRGEVYATGYIQLEAPIMVQGKLSAKRFLMKRPSGLYENYLIDVTLNRTLLPKAYLSSALFSSSQPDYQILKWLH